ncbi:MAG: ABC transporter ATP-binding protein, partial [Shimia sp.]
ICGPNGCGKSTLFGVATGQLAPSGGSVTLGAEPIRAIPAKMRARRMALLPQSPDAPADLGVADLVALGRYAHRRAFAGLLPADRSAIARALDATDLADLADRPLAALSGGQRQRAWIAMTLAQDAPLILLDEPTNHLDVSHAIETMRLLRGLVEAGKTVVVVLHDINLMAAFADEVVLMKDGRIAAAGTFETVVTEPAISALYGLPCTFATAPNRDRPMLAMG